KGISSSGRILLSLINDILDLSKLEASKMTLKYEWVNIRDFMDHIEKVFILNAKNKQIDFLIEMDTDFPRYVFMDEIRVRQVLINLIGNAIKFTHEGYVKLKISYHNDTQEVGKNDLIFMVEDTGIGIADDNLEEIFNAFTQQKSLNMIHYGGTGLGLAICKKTLDIMNGEIFVSSQVGKGSTFEVKLKDIALNNLKNVSMHPIDIDVTVILEAFQTDKKFKKHMVSLLVQSKNALKMNLIKQISTELIEFGVKSSHEPIIELGTHLKKSIEEIDLEQCNRIVNQLKRVLIPVEERHD
ncbi:MAG: hypothetical protein H7X94_06785, partial [Vallitaleaceae bacterium]|nr:hypothetical protein [Vallitaleaceae bacterium]